MDGNSSERGRHRHRAHPTGPAVPGDPQWIPPSDDRPQWTQVGSEQRSWFDAPLTPETTGPAPAGVDPDATAAWPTPLVPPPADPGPRAAAPAAPAAGLGPRAADPAARAVGSGPHAADPALPGLPAALPGPGTALPAARPVDGPRTAEGPRSVDGPRPVDGPRMAEGPRPFDGPNPVDGPRGADGSLPVPGAGSAGSAPDPVAGGWDPAATDAWSPMAGGFRPAAGRRDDGPATDSWSLDAVPPAWGATETAGRPERPWGAPTGQHDRGWGAAAGPDDRAWAARPGQGGGAGPADPARAAGATRWDPPPAPAGAAPARRHAVRHPIRLALFALVLFGLVAGSAAWMSMDKSVRLTVDGEARAVSTYASTVGGVLDDAGVTVGDHDTLAPGREAEVSDGDEIVLRRGRLLTLTVDGKPKQVWVTATTVDEALTQVGFRQSGLFVSANRSERLPLEGYQLTLRTPKKITILADGRKVALTTTAATVGAAMEEAAVTVDGDDKVSQLAGAPVRAGMVVTVTRVERKTTSTRTVIEYETVEKDDPKAEVGSRTVETKGVNGLQEVTRVETYVDGKLISTRIAKTTVLTEPVDEVVVIGPEPPEPVAAQPAGCADFPTTGGLNWCALAKCESGLNPNAYNPAGPYYGLYQFDQGTWTSSGGSGSPSGKSVAEQTQVAYNLYQARGASPWPVCGRQL